MGAAKGAAKLTGTLALIDVAVKTASAIVAVIIAVKAAKALTGNDGK